MVSLAIAAVITSTQIRGSTDAPSALLVRSDGAIVERVDLAEDRQFSVIGPLGATRIAIQDQRARIVSDPGRQQICVRQGWLERAGDVALCLPNRVSIELVGANRRYDSLNY